MGPKVEAACRFVEATGKNDKAAQAHAWTAGCLFGEVECEYGHNFSFFDDDDTLPNTAWVCKFNRYHWGHPHLFIFKKHLLIPVRIPGVNGMFLIVRFGFYVKLSTN